jgi:hypothetical protein
MKITIVCLAAAALLAGQVASADAATVKPNGKYAFSTVDTCEANFTFAVASYLTGPNSASNAVRSINSVANGHIGTGVGYITFNPSSASGGTFNLNLTNIHGGALRIKNGGVNVVTETQNLSGNYSFTASSMTFSPSTGSPLTFIMAYGSLNASGVPSSVHLARQDSSGETNNCVQSITATK